MKRSLLALFATLAVALGLSAPASAATANPHASCAGKVGASLAGQPGPRAVIAHGVRHPVEPPPSRKSRSRSSVFGSVPLAEALEVVGLSE
jgi:hypothetical protein